MEKYKLKSCDNVAEFPYTIFEARKTLANISCKVQSLEKMLADCALDVEATNKDDRCMHKSDFDDSNDFNDFYGFIKHNFCDGINESMYVEHSQRIFYCNGIIYSDDVACSAGVAYSTKVFESFGVLRTMGVKNSLFVEGVTGVNILFNKPVTRSRMSEVSNMLSELLGEWTPVGNHDPRKMFAGMPRAAIEYIASLPEFDAGLFERITGYRVTSSGGGKPVISVLI